MSYYGWRPYVSVAERRRRATKKMQALRNKGIDIQPVQIEGRKIAKTFWGQAWCDQMESRGDFENRLPRGRTYVRNGSVCHLEIEPGRVTAKVSGSKIYDVVVQIEKLPKKKWELVKQRSSGQIGSLLELLEGKLSDSVMEVVTDPQDGLFPLDREIRFTCNCPDWAGMCKHIAAVLYGIGARLDERPELLFVLRGVNHEELVEVPADAAVARATHRGSRRTVAAADLGDVFGIDLDPQPSETSEPIQSAAPANKTRGRKKSKRKSASSRKAADSTKVADPAKKKARKKTPKNTPRTATSSAKKKPASAKSKPATKKNPTTRKKPATKKKTAKRKEPSATAAARKKRPAKKRGVKAS